MKHKKMAEEIKRAWATPKLMVIDIRQTAGGKTPGPPEGDSVVWQPDIS
jgi:hypothetical protein